MCLKSSDSKTTPSSDVVVSDIEEDKDKDIDNNKGMKRKGK